MCDGAAVSRATYPNLFAAIVPTVGTCTITNATPAVVTLTTHNLQTGDQIYLTTTGALPTGLSINTLYYVIRIDANTFNLATTRANAFVPTKIATSSAGSGVHTLKWCAFGLGDGSTTFNVPDARGRVVAGNDSMNGTVASRLTLSKATGAYGNAGASGGAQDHTLVTAELASHTHGYATDRGGVGYAGGANNSKDSSLGATGSTTGGAGSDTAHNNVQPSLVSNIIIKT
jgi:microcystin-dependent protein